MRRAAAALLGPVLMVPFLWPAAASGHSPRAGASARVWVTTVDRAELLHERAPVTFRKGQSAQPTIVVNPELRYQRMDGFGAAITDSAASVLYRLTPRARDNAVRQLFDSDDGIMCIRDRFHGGRRALHL